MEQLLKIIKTKMQFQVMDVLELDFKYKKEDIKYSIIDEKKIPIQ